jgi:hypothetical protein
VTLFWARYEEPGSSPSVATKYFYPRWYICTTRVYVLLCCSCSCWHGHINQNTALLTNFTMLSAYFCTIAYSLAPAFLAALRTLARQPCSRLPGSLARAAVQTSPNRFSRILHRTLRPDLMRALARSLAPQSPHCTTVAGHQTACARCCPDGFKLVFSPISLCFHYLHERAAVQQKGSNLFSCSYVDLLHHN